MRDYGKVHSSFWTSSDMRELSEDARSLAIYLLTCPHGTIAGVFRLPDGYVTDDMQWTTQRVSRGYTELFAKGFVNRCEATKWVWIIKHFAWNPIEGGPQKTGARKIAAQIPRQCSWIAQYIRDCADLIDWKDHPKNTLSDTLSDTVTSPVTVTVTVDVDVDVPLTNADASSPKKSVDNFKLQKPTKPKDPEKAGSVAFAAYALAFRERYGEEPARNVKVNAHFAQLVSRIGAEDAPRVAAWYVTNESGAYYVTRTHPVDALLRDCEGLLVRMKRGQGMTRAEATQADNDAGQQIGFQRAAKIADAIADERGEPLMLTNKQALALALLEPVL